MAPCRPARRLLRERQGNCDAEAPDAPADAYLCEKSWVYLVIQSAGGNSFR